MKEPNLDRFNDDSYRDFGKSSKSHDYEKEDRDYDRERDDREADDDE